MAYRAAVVGGSGYTGAELLRLLAAHPEIEVVHVTADSNAGSKVADLYPSLGAAYPDLAFCPFEPGDLDGLDVAFLALPHGQSQRHAGAIAAAASGVSGRGRGLSAPSLYSEANENVSAYGLLTHRHTAEMELALGRLSPTGEAQVLFTPHLVPMTRGILATCYARPAAGGEAARLGTDGLLAHYRHFYAGEPFVAVLDQPPATKATAGSNAVHVTVRFDPRTDTVLAISAEDNLVKGAS